MSDPQTTNDQPTQAGDRPRAKGRTPRGIFRDPVVRGMTYLALGVVILFLVTVVSALLTGLLGSGPPGTLAQRQVAVSGAAIRSGTADAATWGEYIAGLIADGQFAAARGAIAEGRASVDDSATAEFTLAEARLARARGDLEEAIAAADVAMEQIKELYDADIAAGGLRAKAAQSTGLHDNYYTALLIKAYAYEDLGEWAKAIEQFDLYIAGVPGAADILTDRGYAKIETGDTAGAEADFRAALEFDPQNDQALAGLDTIGAAR